MSQYTRRRLVAAGIGFTTISALAGCTSNDADGGDSTGDGPGAQSSFFVFGDFATHVAGDAATAETLVPVGQHGHGWEPGPDIQGTILESDLFVYGTDGFQPWVGDLITSLRDDGADVEMVPVGEGVDLIEGGHDHGGEDEHGHEEEEEHEDDHDESLGEHAISHACGHMESGETEPLAAASAQGDTSTFSQTHQPYAVELTEGASYVRFEPESGGTEKYAFFTDTHETVRPVETSIVHEAHSVESCDAIEEYYVVETDASAVTIELSGDAGTVVTLLAEGVSDDHNHGEEDEHGHEEEHEDEDEHDHEGEDEHDHGAMDPHFWLDPQRAAQAVGTLEATFAEMDGQNAGVYADNAAAYRDQLEDLDDEIQSIVDDAPKNTLFVAGHDAFQYLEDRYGLRVESLTSLSPDDQPTPRDIERAQDIIDEHGLAHVCADPLEDQTAAEQLVEETDATGMLPLTAIPGQTSEWADNDWGYIEIMENINLDTLETALNA
ncbi:metal ABC transporter substrate-binding protein [Halorubrum sp. AJ67]|uniref:metal ABC transporter substrate-binding protein n=1 Tax=Halorubrum sp. AJ67 TaxID=1173487 RepID=UPI0003DD65F4|nr:metal ABC transporter substrate-binding protein [Halorubrum sp. AJ67]CDK37876.1 putative signal peptide protein [Halorubrum sp. AJ67]